MPDSESTIDTLRTYHEGGHCGDGINHLYLQTLGAKRLGQGPQLISQSHPYTFPPPVKFRDHCHLAPTDPQEWLQELAVIPSWVHYEHRWGPNYSPGLGLPLDSFTSDQQRHLVAHWMSNLPTMMVLVVRSKHRNVRLCTQCLLCDNSPETACHLWECPV